MRIVDRVLMALEGIGMALESLRANNVRMSALTCELTI